MRWKSWKTKPMKSRRNLVASAFLPTAAPANVTAPAVGSSNNPRMLRREVLPAPEGPMTHTNSPPATPRLTFLRAWTVLAGEAIVLIQARDARYVSFGHGYHSSERMASMGFIAAARAAG